MDAVDAFRDNPGDHVTVAKMLGVDNRTALKLWEHGWKRHGWARAIRIVLMEEDRDAEEARREIERAKRQEEIDRLASERMMAIEARADELSGAQTSRKSAIAFAVVSQKLVRSANALANELNVRLGRGDAAEMSLAEMRDLIRTVAYTVDKSERILRMALEIERVVAGDPTAVSEHRGTSIGTPEERAVELERVLATLERAKARGGMRVLNGVAEVVSS